MKYIFTLSICNMPAIRSSKHNNNKQGRTHKMSGGYKNFTIYFYRNTKPNQTSPQSILFTNRPLLPSQSLKAEAQFINPHVPSKQACIRTKGLSCYIRKSKWSERQLTTNASSFPANTTNPNNANSEQYLKLHRMLHSSHGIKISQKNTLENFFSLWIPRGS